MFATYAPRLLIWRAMATNSAVLTVATLVLAISPATASLPIADAERWVIAELERVLPAEGVGMRPGAMLADRTRVLTVEVG